MTKIDIVLKSGDEKVQFPAESVSAETEMDGPLILNYTYTIELPDSVDVEVDHDVPIDE